MIPTLHSVPSNEARPITLKLFASGPTLSPHSTLRDCCDVYLWPALEEDEVSPASLVEYQGFLSLWERYMGDRPVGTIDREAAKDFRKALIEKPYLCGTRKVKRSPATVNKVMRYFGSVIRKLWPADRQNPAGPGLVPLFKLPRPLPAQAELPLVFSLADLSSLYRSAHHARTGRRPSHAHNPDLWRLALVLAFNVGARSGDLKALRWKDVLWDDFKYGAVRFRSRKKAKLQRIPLNRLSRIHLDYVRSLQIDDERIFPAFGGNKVSFAAWKRIAAAAGLGGSVMEDMRKTCSTHIGRVIPGANVAAWICGHGPKDVNGAFYQNPTREVLQSIYRVKQPAAFRQGARELLQRLQASPAG